MSRVFTGDAGDFLRLADELWTGVPLYVVMWFKCDNLDARRQLWHYRNNAAEEMEVRINATGSISYRTLFTNQLNASSADGTITVGTPFWSLAIATLDDAGVDLNLYTDDGVASLNSQQSAWGASNTPTLTIGTTFGGSDFPFSGKIAEIAVYNTLPSGADITELQAGVAPDSLTSGTSNLIEYWALTDSSLTGVNSKVLSLTGTVASDAGDNPLTTGLMPLLTLITDPITTGGSATLTGVNFGATQGTGFVTQEGLPVTEDSWSDTSVGITTLTIESTILKYGNHVFELTNDDGNSDTISADVVPGTNKDFENIVTPHTPQSERLISDPDLGGGEQIRHSDVLFQGGSPTAFGVDIFDDARGSISGSPPDGTYQIPFRVWDDGDSTWGAEANQTVIIGAGGVVENNSVIVKSIIQPIINPIIEARADPSTGAYEFQDGTNVDFQDGTDFDFN